MKSWFFAVLLVCAVLIFVSFKPHQEAITPDVLELKKQAEEALSRDIPPQDNDVVVEEEKSMGVGYYDFILDNLQGGGPPKDGIPAIDHPQYVSASESLLADDALVYGLAYEGEAFAFPQNILYWHEIVNEQIAGERVSVTYCPLTGSVVGYKNVNLGVSGKLYNSNLVLYDRATDSLIPQILGVGMDKGLQGKKLESIHIVQASWKDWRTKYPETKVLTEMTGFDRDYTRNPYPGYEDLLRVWFPLAAESDAFPSKEMMIGITIGATHHAVAKKDVVGENFNVGGVTFTWDPVLKDHTPDKPVEYMDVYWFAWYAYHPDTIIR